MTDDIEKAWFEHLRETQHVLYTGTDPTPRYHYPKERREYFDAGYRAGQSEWIKVQDMPEKWKKQETLDYYHPVLGRITNLEPENAEDMTGITHAMLTPPPQHRRVKND